MSNTTDNKDWTYEDLSEESIAAAWPSIGISRGEVTTYVSVPSRLSPEEIEEIEERALLLLETRGVEIGGRMSFGVPIGYMFQSPGS